MTVFYIIRHAAIRRAPGDPGITPEGQQQALRVAAFLREKDIARVYSSPLNRALQTAERLAAALRVPLEMDYRLRERINWGDVPGQAWEQFVLEWDKGDADPDYESPGGHSPRMAAARMADFLKHTAPLFSDQSVAAVSHGGIIGDYVALCFAPEDILRFQPAWSTLRSDVIDYTSLTTVRWKESGPVLEGFAALVY